MAVVWPHGSTARFDPVELLDAGGQVVAREGDLVSLTGGFVPHDGDEPCDLGHDERWWTHEVVARTP